MSRILLVYGGGNGSGKSTVTAHRQPIGHYVNADEIKAHLRCDNLEAAQIAEQTRECLLAENQSFTMESVLSTERNFILMERAKGKGYHVCCIYMLTNDPEINKARIEERAKKGGHFVEPEVVERRYWRAMALIPRLFETCNECYIFDNSLNRSVGEPSCIAAWANGALELFPSPIWPAEKLGALVTGKYSSVDEI
jgi:predicted ABC-type ATPase